MPEITVYTTEPCVYCTRVKSILKAHDAQFEEVIVKDHDGRMELASRTGMTTFPQVFIGEELLGGFTETQAAVESGRLRELLSQEGLANR